MMEIEYCISSDNETFYNDSSSIEEAHKRVAEEFTLKDGDIYYIGEVAYPAASEFIFIDDIIETIGENASYECGEHADEWPDIGVDDRRKLEKIIIEFIEERSRINFFRVKNIKKYRYVNKAVNNE